MRNQRDLPAVTDRGAGIVAPARAASLAAAALVLAAPLLVTAADVIPHGAVARAPDGAGVVAAWFADPTERYPHGVLGDAIEGGALVMIDDDGAEWRVILPAERVFEDLTPRIADVTGDGRNDVIAVESEVASGASLAVYGVDRAGPRKLAATPHIGRPWRWLAPAGIADFDGDGVADAAYVETPHLGGTLRAWSFRDGQAREIAAARGFSNHRIGEAFIAGGLRDCGSGPELVLPDFGWRRTLIARVVDGAIEHRVYAADAAAATLARALDCR